MSGGSAALPFSISPSKLEFHAGLPASAPPAYTCAPSPCRAPLPFFKLRKAVLRQPGRGDAAEQRADDGAGKGEKRH